MNYIRPSNNNEEKYESIWIDECPVKCNCYGSCIEKIQCIPCKIKHINDEYEYILLNYNSLQKYFESKFNMILQNNIEITDFFKFDAKIISIYDDLIKDIKNNNYFNQFPHTKNTESLKQILILYVEESKVKFKGNKNIDIYNEIYTFWKRKCNIYFESSRKIQIQDENQIYHYFIPIDKDIYEECKNDESNNYDILKIPFKLFINYQEVVKNYNKNVEINNQCLSTYVINMIIKEGGVDKLYRPNFLPFFDKPIFTNKDIISRRNCCYGIILFLISVICIFLWKI